MKQVHAAHRNGDVRRFGSSWISNGISGTMNKLNKPKGNVSRTDPRYGSYLVRLQNSLLRRVLRGGNYLKLYSYQYLVNGLVVLITPQQADKLAKRREVANVVLDFSVRTTTTHNPEFFGLLQGAWGLEGGPDVAGEGIVIRLIDTGIDPAHPSFSDDLSVSGYPVPAHVSGVSEVTNEFPSGSCNQRLVGARYFAAPAITRGIFNVSQDYPSPIDGDGHRTHTTPIVAGNHGILGIVSGHNFGNASDMAHAHIVVYMAVYKGFRDYVADVLTAIDQAAQDGVDIISLSITPNRRPPGLASFFNPVDVALLPAVKTGIFVVQAAGNTGPSPKSLFPVCPWIFTVGVAAHDRIYTNYIVVGNYLTISGVGLAPATDGDSMHNVVSAIQALSKGTDATNVGDEGGFAPNIQESKEGLELLKKSGAIEGFDEMPQQDVSSWTVVISAMVTCCRYEEIFELFCKMKMEGRFRDRFTSIMYRNKALHTINSSFSNGSLTAHVIMLQYLEKGVIKQAEGTCAHGAWRNASVYCLVESYMPPPEPPPFRLHSLTRKVCLLFCIFHLLVGMMKSMSRHPSLWIISLYLALASSVFFYGFEIWMVADREKQGHIHDLLNAIFWFVTFFESTSLIGSQGISTMLVKGIYNVFPSSSASTALLAMISFSLEPANIAMTGTWLGWVARTVGNYIAGVVGNLRRALEYMTLLFDDGNMTHILKDLSSTLPHLSVKPLIFSCFGNIALAIGERFETYLCYTMPIPEGVAEISGEFEKLSDRQMRKARQLGRNITPALRSSLSST